MQAGVRITDTLSLAVQTSSALIWFRGLPVDLVEAPSPAVQVARGRGCPAQAAEAVATRFQRVPARVIVLGPEKSRRPCATTAVTVSAGAAALLPALSNLPGVAAVDDDNRHVFRTKGRRPDTVPRQLRSGRRCKELGEGPRVYLFPSGQLSVQLGEDPRQRRPLGRRVDVA